MPAPRRVRIVEANPLEMTILDDIRASVEVNRRAILYRIQTGTYEICKEPTGEIMKHLREAIGMVGPKMLNAIRISTGRFVTSGLDGRGGSDLYGHLRKTGRVVALEVKRPSGGVVSEEQRRFLTTTRANGGFGAVVRSVEEAIAALDRAAAGLSE